MNGTTGGKAHPSDADVRTDRRLHRIGDIDEHTLHELERDLDLEELSALSAKA
ncbi:hypothetical protein [Sphingomonas sp. SRS2]|uniref:hypothetical protein n=1 Tax=Sphingomonas sp. SRS2 TaxID=133190 RepID=UPI001364C794|nr:hypothetical protein [Sphingomonas sp. SRS2]